MALSQCIGNINDAQLELVAHGTFDFPVAAYHDDLHELEVEWHWHPEFEWILVSEGSSLITAGSQTLTVQAGDGLFINSEVLHSGYLATNETCFYHSFVFHPLLIGGNFDSIYWNRYVLPLMQNHSLECVHFSKANPQQKELLDALENAWQAMKEESLGFEFTVRNALSQLILAISTQHSHPQHLSKKVLRDHERMKRMMNYIAEHIEEEITVHNIAKCAMISESECLRCFKSTINTTPIQYVKQARLNKAATLLNSTSMTISDIANRCGYPDISYFIRLFKQMYRKTPTEYRTFTTKSKQ